MTSSSAEEPPANDAVPSLAAIFLAFAGIAAMGFGGVLPWARWMLVEKREWLTAEEFTEVIALGSILPGGNIINAGVVVGQRFQGAAGSLVAVIGLLAAPIVTVILLGSLYAQYGDSPAVHHGLSGVAAAAAGLILSTALKMAMPLLRKGNTLGLAFAGLTFTAIGIFGLPLPFVLLAIAPVSVASVWWRTR